MRQRPCIRQFVLHFEGMKQRSALTATLLSVFVPLYILYWLYVTAKAMQDHGIKTPNFILLVGPLCGFVPLIILGAVSQSSSSAAFLRAIVLLLGVGVMIAAVAGPLLYYYQFSQATEQLTQGKIAKVAAFLLLFFVAPAAVYILQDALNNMGTRTLPADPPITPTQ